MTKNFVIPEEAIVSKIYLIRAQKVMLDKDLAAMFGVETRRLNEQVKRNIDRFPDDFMFQLTELEYKNLMSQNATSSWGGRRKMPYAFAEHGVLMLSHILKSEIAVEVSIRITRIFTKLREMILTHKDILIKLEKIERNMILHNERTNQNEDDIQTIFNVLKQLLNPPPIPREPIGFKIGVNNNKI